MIESMYSEKDIQEMEIKIKEVAERLMELQHQYGMNFVLSANLWDGRTNKKIYDAFFMNENITPNSLMLTRDWVTEELNQLKEIMKLISEKRIVVCCLNDTGQHPLVKDKLRRGQYYVVNRIVKIKYDYFLYELEGMDPGSDFGGYGSKRFSVTLDSSSRN